LEIEQDEVVVCKGDRGLPGSKIYVANRIAVAQSLSSKFLGSFHLQSKNAAGKNVQKSKHIQDEIVSNLEVMKKFKERVHQYDMRTPLQVHAVYHDILGEDAWEALWDSSNPHRKIVDFTLPWGTMQCAGKLAGHRLLDWSFYALILVFPVIWYFLFGSLFKSQLRSLVSGVKQLLRGLVPTGRKKKRCPHRERRARAKAKDRIRRWRC
jgi:hypothetical protein